MSLNRDILKKCRNTDLGINIEFVQVSMIINNKFSFIIFSVVSMGRFPWAGFDFPGQVSMDRFPWAGFPGQVLISLGRF
jgi:hypothetical protein